MENTPKEFKLIRNISATITLTPVHYRRLIIHRCDVAPPAKIEGRINHTHCSLRNIYSVVLVE